MLGSCAMRGRQPPKALDDGSFSVRVVDERHLLITGLTKDGVITGTVVLSEYNAWALIGVLSLFVGLKLPDRIGRRIQIFGKPREKGR